MHFIRSDPTEDVIKDQQTSPVTSRIIDQPTISVLEAFLVFAWNVAKLASHLTSWQHDHFSSTKDLL